MMDDDTITPGDRARSPIGGGPPRTTLYTGRRGGSSCAVLWKRHGDTGVSSLPPRLDLVNHSPTGFEWGYGGSGPAQLAFALCQHVLDDTERARRVYQAFKFAVIAPLPRDESWSMTGGFILQQIEQLEARQ